MSLNWKTVLGTLSTIGAAVALAIAHNIDGILAHPATIVTIVLTAIAGALFGHNAGTTSAQANGTTGT